MHEPRLTRVENRGCAFWSDEALSMRSGVFVAFSERTGGLSRFPYRSLNLASHVGDDEDRVDENRTRLLAAADLSDLRDRLVTADQVHGSRVALIGRSEAGSGAWAGAHSPPVAATDVLVTTETDIPLMLLFADCVPVILVTLAGEGPVVAVVHAGWRGVLAGVAGAAARTVSHVAACSGADVLAYIGPHICVDHYDVGPDIASQFSARFGTVSRAETGRLDLGAAVSQSLVEAGVAMSSQCHLDACTAEQTDRFFSHRADGLTGRHGAIAVIRGRRA